MPVTKLNNQRLPNNKLPKPVQNSVPPVSSTKKKFFIGVENLPVSKRILKKAEAAEITKSEVGIQVDELKIIANEREQFDEEVGDGPVYRMPSARVVKEIEKMRAMKQNEELKVRLNETRKFEAYAAKEEVHLENLKEFLETGAITRKDTDGRVDECRREVAIKPRTELEA